MRKWTLGALAALGIAVAAAAYHLWVMRHGAEHFRLLKEAPTVEAKRRHYDEIHRYFHPSNPYRDRARRWLEEEGHEWEFLRGPGRQ